MTSRPDSLQENLELWNIADQMRYCEDKHQHRCKTKLRFSDAPNLKASVEQGVPRCPYLPWFSEPSSSPLPRSHSHFRKLRGSWEWPGNLPSRTALRTSGNDQFYFESFRRLENWKNESRNQEWRRDLARKVSHVVPEGLPRITNWWKTKKRMDAKRKKKGHNWGALVCLPSSPGNWGLREQLTLIGIGFHLWFCLQNAFMKWPSDFSASSLHLMKHKESKRKWENEAEQCNIGRSGAE